MTDLVGLDRYLQKLARIPDSVKVAVREQLGKNADDLVAAIQRATPVNDLDPHPGDLRKSVHSYPVADRSLSVRVIADARDEKGEPYGRHVEAGHKTPGGEHVASRPFFFPTYRARKKKMKAALRAAARAAIKAL